MNSDWKNHMFDFFAVIGFGIFLAFVALVLTGLAALGLIFIKDWVT